MDEHALYLGADALTGALPTPEPVQDKLPRLAINARYLRAHAGWLAALRYILRNVLR